MILVYTLSLKEVLMITEIPTIVSLISLLQLVVLLLFRVLVFVVYSSKSFSSIM